MRMRMTLAAILATALCVVMLRASSSDAYNGEMPMIPSWQKPPQVLAPVQVSMLSHGRIQAKPADYTVVAKRNTDLTMRLLADVRIPDGVGEINWPLYVPPVFSDSHEQVVDMRNMDVRSEASAGVFLRGPDELAIVSFGLNSDDALEVSLISSDRSELDHIRWNLRRDDDVVTLASGTLDVHASNTMITLNLDDEVGGHFRATSASASYNFTAIEESSDNTVLGAHISSRIDVVGDSQMEILSFGINADGLLEAEWRLAHAVSGSCNYTLMRRGGPILASGIAAVGQSSIVFDDIDLVEDAGARRRRRRLSYAPPSTENEANEQRTANASALVVDDAQPGLRYDNLAEAEVILEAAMAATGISVYDVYYDLRPNRLRTAPRSTRFGKAAILANTERGRGDLYSLSSPQGSAAAATVMGYTFHLLGTQNENIRSATESDRSDTFASNSTDSNRGVFGHEYVLIVREIDAASGYVLSSAIASASVNVGANGTAFGTGDADGIARLHISSFGPNAERLLEVRWTASAIARDINYFRCTLRRSGLSTILDTAEIRTDGNSSRNVYVFSDANLADATAVYTALVEEIDFQGNTVASATASMSSAGDARIVVRNISTQQVGGVNDETTSNLEVHVSLADPSANAFHFVLIDSEGNRIAEGIEHSTRHVFTGLNASSASGEFAVIVSEIGDRGVGSGDGFVPELVVKKLQLKLRGLRHSSPEDLRVELRHLGRSVVVVREGTVNLDNRLRFGALSAEGDDDGGAASFGFSPLRAFDYIFDDALLGDNLALGKLATQRSTKFGGWAAKAVDGNVDGHFSLGSVTHTALGRSPWWQVDLGDVETVRTVRVWTRQEEAPVDGVAQIEIYSDYPLSGHFTVDLTHAGVTRTTEPIPCDAVAMIGDETSLSGPSLQRRLLDLDNFGGEIRVKALAPSAAAALDHNFVRQWLVTFSISEHSSSPRFGIARGLPTMSAPLPSSSAGLAHSSASVEIRSLRNLLHRRGIASSGRQKDTGGDGLYAYNKEARFEEQSSVFPMWIFLYADGAPPASTETFESAMSAATAAFRIDDRSTTLGVVAVAGDREVIVTFKAQRARHVRVQLEPADYVHLSPSINGTQRQHPSLRYLSLAEVEVFRKQANLLSSYRAGTPIRPGHYTPESSLDSAFGNLPIGGPWVLSLRDVTTSAFDRHGEGSIDDWQLLVTDQFGVEHIYYTDMRATVSKLPNFGTLRRVNKGSDFASTERGERLTPVPGEVASRRACYNADCSHRFGVGAARGAQRQQSTAARNRLMGERLVVYVPNENFTGADSFSYVVGFGASQSAISGTVNIRVRKCRSSALSVTEGSSRAPATSSVDIITGAASTFCDDDAGDDYDMFNWANEARTLSSRILGVPSELPHPLDGAETGARANTFYNPSCVGSVCSVMENLGRTHTSIGTDPPQPVLYNAHYDNARASYEDRT